MLKRLVGITLVVLMMLSMTVAALTETGTIEILDSTEAQVMDRIFVAYKILELELSEEEDETVTPSFLYRVPNNEALKNFYLDYFKLTFTDMDKLTEQVVDRISKLDNAGMEVFAKKAYLAASATGSDVDSYTIDYTEDGDGDVDVPYGYYVIGQTSPLDSGRISAVMVDSIEPKAVIYLKADDPSITKSILDDGPWSSASIGDIITYVLETRMPDMTGFTPHENEEGDESFHEVYQFIIQDIMAPGMTLIDDEALLDGFTVTIHGADDIELERATDRNDRPEGAVYHVEHHQGDVGGLRISIVFHNMLQYKYDKDMQGAITVEYSAVLNEEAQFGNEGNMNTALVRYSYDPFDEISTRDSEEAETRVYSTGIIIGKYATDEYSEEQVPLSGAKFKLVGDADNINIVINESGFEYVVAEEGEEGQYWLLKDGRYTDIDPYGEGVSSDPYDNPDVSWNRLQGETFNVTEDGEEKYIEAWVDDSGRLILTGLNAGKYTLTEEVAPKGYKKLLDPIEFEIKISGNESGPGAHWWCESENDEVDFTSEGFALIQVMNEKGLELPSTGGIGTTLFTIGGLLLMGIALAVIVLRRRAATGK